MDIQQLCLPFINSITMIREVLQSSVVFLERNTERASEHNALWNRLPYMSLYIVITLISGLPSRQREFGTEPISSER
jgi:hypothetical protein